MFLNSLIRALTEEESVTITEFGTFSVKKNPAQIKDNVVFPPHNSIEFEYSKNVEGFDFVSKLSKWEQIRIDEAQTEVSKWVKMLENGLEHNPTIFYDDFGTFSKDSSGKIVFQGIINVHLNIENEGYEPIVLPILHKTEKKTEQPESFNKTNKEELRNSEIQIQDKRIVHTNRKKRKSDRALFLVIIILVPLILGALFYKEIVFYCKQTLYLRNKESVVFSDETPASSALISTKKVVIDDDIPKVTTDEESPNAVASTAVETPADVPSKPTSLSGVKAKIETLPFQKGNYYVIAGSFASKENAIRLIKNEELELYHPKFIHLPNSNLFRVCIGVFDNEEDARFFAEQFEKNYWVLK